jgi:hypothetical protein
VGSNFVELRGLEPLRKPSEIPLYLRKHSGAISIDDMKRHDATCGNPPAFVNHKLHTYGKPHRCVHGSPV